MESIATNSPFGSTFEAFTADRARQKKPIDEAAWKSIRETYHVGDVVNLRVDNVSPVLGVFAQVAPGVNALAHVNAIRGLNGRNPVEVFSPGETRTFTVLRLDDEKRRMALAAEIPAGGTAPIQVAMPSAQSPVGLEHPAGRTPGAQKPSFAEAASSARSWIAAHPYESAAAEKWLSDAVKDAPIHANTLAELKQFGVPKPLSAWIREVVPGKYFSLGPKNAKTQHPAVGLNSRMEDPAYWTTLQKSLPMPALQSGPAENPVPRAVTVCEGLADAQSEPRSGDKNIVLVDGSNILFSETGGATGGLLLQRTLRALRWSGRTPYLVFDANIKYKLRASNDRIAADLIDSIETRDPQRYMQVPAGTRADDYILCIADQFGYDVISCDRFREFSEKYPWTAASVESGNKRVHQIAIWNGVFLIPWLDIKFSVKDLDLGF